MKIVMLDRATLAPQVQIRRPGFEHVWIEHNATRQDEVVDRLNGAEIAILNKVVLRKEAIVELPELKFVAVAATGTDNVDVDACAERGIVVSNIRDYAVNTVPEHSFALILALRRALLAYRQDIVAGRWIEAGQFCFFDHEIRDLHGSILGIIGEGAIGQSVAAIGRAFGMKIRFAAHKGLDGLGPLYTPFDQVMAECDVISLHCPLTEKTRGMISDREFDLMQRHAILVNTARGGLVDEVALVRALREGKIGAAGMDVATQEPPAIDHPLMKLLNMPNFILTPHTAWASTEAMQALADQLIENVEAFAARKPRHNVATGSLT